MPFQMPDGQKCPPRMAAGNYAVEPRAASAQYGAPGVQPRKNDPTEFVLCPEDVQGLQPILGKGRRSGCCGPSGQDGPNLACACCNVELGTEMDDCCTC